MPKTTNPRTAGATSLAQGASKQSDGDGPAQRKNGSRSAKWHRRRQEIIDTSAKLFARQGYHGTGMAELCEANGLAKGAFYYYIGSKEELLEAINDRIMDEMMLGADRVGRAGGAPGEQLAMLGNEFDGVLVRFPDHLWVLMRDYPALTGEHAKRFARRRREYEERVEAIIQSGVDSGEFRQIDVDHAAQAWIATKTNTWRMGHERQTASTFASTFEDIFVRGISTRS